MLTTNHRSKAAAGLLVIGLLFAGCSTDGDEDTKSTTTTAEGKTTTTAEGKTTTSQGDDTTPSTNGTETTEGKTTPSGDEAAYVEAMAADLAGAGGFDFAGDEALNCVAQKTVDIVGVEELKKQGITPEQVADGDYEMKDLLDLDQAKAVMGSFKSCDISFFDMMKQVSTDEQFACLEKHVTEAQLAEIMAHSMIDQKPTGDLAKLSEEVKKCSA